MWIRLSFLMILAAVLCGCNQTSAGGPTTDSGLLGKAMRGEAQIVDLGYVLNPSTPYWPGGAYEPFKFETIATLEKDHVFSGKFEMPEHLGTHLDAPNHFAAGQISVDQIKPQNLIAPMVVIDDR